jgi:hypothetical protein
LEFHSIDRDCARISGGYLTVGLEEDAEFKLKKKRDGWIEKG